jgi:hypothetical protein
MRRCNSSLVTYITLALGRTLQMRVLNSSCQKKIYQVVAIRFLISAAADHFTVAAYFGLFFCAYSATVIREELDFYFFNLTCTTHLNNC